MKRLISSEEEEFLDFILKSFFNEKKEIYLQLVNYEKIEQAVGTFLDHYSNEDSLNNSNHSEIINKIFNENALQDCEESPDLGISKRTFYRYKQKYLYVFKNFLFQSINAEQVNSTLKSLKNPNC